MSRLLEYTPGKRATSFSSLAHPFFDELRSPNCRLPNGRDLPPLFDFSPHELSIEPLLNAKIIPNHLILRTCASSSTNNNNTYFNDIVVGAVCCRREITDDNKHKLYIMTLGCLPAYRRLGLDPNSDPKLVIKLDLDPNRENLKFGLDDPDSI
uniref:Uncharacterized protein n=1 Tax=Romanomermis culicivorax TaxID=13658 RepID=A0A915JW85_ROMCU